MRTALDTTESIAGTTAAEHEPNASVPPDGHTDAIARETQAAGGSPTDSEHAAQAPEQDGPPRPRRRRRRRRRPLSGSPAISGSAEAVDAPSAGADLPPRDEAADGAAEDGSADTAVAGEANAEGAAPERPILRLQNRRRRRRRPAAPGLLPGTAEPESAAGVAAPATVAGVSPGQRSFHAPRRQRRQAPLSAADPTTAAGSAEHAGETSDGASSAPPGTHPARSRNRRRRRARPEAGADQSAGQQQPREGDAPGQRSRGDDQRYSARDGQPARGRRGDERRERGRPGPGRGRRDGHREAPRKIERKLYSFDSVVDRGFEDVEDENGSRRVHWTIVKRTTADQVSRKALSTVYVLQREGDDSEFPGLGAARSAVNKTIVHPEKLTRSKAEHAAEKAGKK